MNTRNSRGTRVVAAQLFVLLSACGGEDATTNAEAAAASSGSGGAGTSSSTGPSASSASTGGGGGAGAASPGCEAMAMPPGMQTFTIDFGGMMRVYDLQIPLSYDATSPVPLVLDFHGFTSNKEQQELVSGIKALGESEGFVVAWPDGFSNSWNAGDFCCGQAQSQGLDDVGLAKAIVAEVSAKLCIDSRRVYATGISNGGAMSHRLACEAADVFAATAPVSYPIDFMPFDKCKPSRPIAVIHQHGKNDIIVPYDGTAAMQSTPESFAYWGKVDGCTGTPEVTYQKDDSKCETYKTCDAGVNVTLCTIDGGHVLYSNNDAVPVADLAWKFLSSFTLP